MTLPSLEPSKLRRSLTEGDLSLLASGEKFFAILDACDEPQVLKMVSGLGSRGVCLYGGKSAERYRDIAPYLVTVDLALLQWISRNLTGKPWGVFVVSQVSLIETRKHLRQFLTVELEERSVYFRFYDPRVLPPFLQSTEEPDRQAFFGPIEKFIAPTDDAQQFVELSC